MRFNARAIAKIQRAVPKALKDPGLVRPRPAPIYLDGRLWHDFKNTSGETIPAWALLHISSSTTATADEPIITLNATKPSAIAGGPLFKTYAINGPIEIASNAYGRCTFDAADALYDTGTPAPGELWGPKPGQWNLAKHWPGFAMLGIVSTTDKRALVRPVPINYLRGKTDGPISKGGTGTVSIWIGDPTSSGEEDSNIDVTAHSRYGAISSSKWVGLFPNGATWDAVATEC